MWNHINMIKIIKSFLPFWLKFHIIKILVAVQYLYYYVMPSQNKSIQPVDNDRIFVLFSTDYSNLGDHALTYAHINLLKESFPERVITEVVVSDTLRYIKQISKTIKPNDVITLKGGGNVGIEYFREELLRRIVIRKFKRNKIILFPQTVYFPNTRMGKKEFNKTIKAYSSHSRFHMFLRDRESYNLVRGLVDNTKLIPDIVLSLKNQYKGEQRSGITICLRNDVEGIHSLEDREKIINISKMYSKDIKVTDTTTEYKINLNDRRSELFKIWSLFSSSELVITDRLHGMIFAVITSTPCIALGTYNYKLIGQYRWLKHLNYLKFINIEENNIDLLIEELKQIKVEHYNESFYKQHYMEIINIIR